jgi:hypothetical protein
MTELFRRLVCLAVLFVVSTVVVSAFADPPSVAATREAGKHFARGVSLYSEADYTGALVEFKRTYSIAPNSTVLYNIGETEYQLQHYANALKMLEQYLAEAGAMASHRTEVEATVEQLRSRVGSINVTTNVAGAEILVDDESVGRTPLPQAVLVSVGRRKITATLEGRAPTTRFVEVATGDVVPVPLNFVDTARTDAAGAPASATGSGSSRGTWLAVGWTVTGVFAAGGIGTGIAAIAETNTLKNERGTYPVSATTLHQTQTAATTFSVLADSLGLAAIIVGSVSLYFTVAGRSDSKPPPTALELHLGPGQVGLGGTF